MAEGTPKLPNFHATPTYSACSWRYSCNMYDGMQLILLLGSRWCVMIRQYIAVPLFLTRIQGGAVTAAFTAIFPHLVRTNVVLVAAIGLMEV